MLDAIIFDVDGTLAETEDVHLAAFNDAFAAAGLPWRWDEARYERLLLVTGGKERIAHSLQDAGLPPLPPDAVAALHAAKTAQYGARVQAGRVALRPGVARLIAEARAAGVMLAIATTTSLPNVEALLTATLGAGSLGWFAAVGAGDMVAAKKPAPDIYDWVVRRLGVAPGRCVALEDSENGVRSAAAAGVPVVVTMSRWSGGHDFAGALAVVDGLGEPDAPCRVAVGRAPAGGMVDLGAVQGWLAASHVNDTFQQG